MSRSKTSCACACRRLRQCDDDEVGSRLSQRRECELERLPPRRDGAASERAGTERASVAEREVDAVAGGHAPAGPGDRVEQLERGYAGRRRRGGDGNRLRPCGERGARGRGGDCESGSEQVKRPCHDLRTLRGVRIFRVVDSRPWPTSSTSTATPSASATATRWATSTTPSTRPTSRRRGSACSAT